MRPFALISALVALALPLHAAAEGEASDAKASVRVLPARPIEPGATVTIEGIAPLDAKGAVAVRVQPPNRAPQIRLDVNPSANGDYSVRFTGTTLPGTYGVGVASPGGKAVGSARFEVVVMEDVEVLEIAVAKALDEADAVEDVLEDIVDDLDAQVPKLPDNPAKEELKTRLDEIKTALAKARGGHRQAMQEVLEPIRQFAATDPALKPLLRLPAQALDDWTRRSAAERQRIASQLDASRRANVTCEQLERVIEGFKFAAAFAKALVEPLALITDPMKELAKNVAQKVVTPALQRLNLAPEKMRGLLEKLAEKKESLETAVGKAYGHAESKKKSQQGLLEKLGNAAAWLAGKVFDRYCERFSGPFDGTMFAEFFAQQGGEKWWEYSIRLKGQLDLRYAKSDVAGAATRVNGEFTGQAVDFTLKEDAIRVGWPKLTASARMFKRAALPVPWLLGTPMPDDPRGVEIEGKAAAVLVKPYSFMVPVQGELVDDVLTLRFKAATHDYTANARVVYVIVSPLSLVPVATAFELPYKDAGFFFLRVSNGEAVKLKVRRGAKAMSASETVRNAKGNGVAKGRYQLKLDLCNPAGAC
jgi:hypothetical protein